MFFAPTVGWLISPLVLASNETVSNSEIPIQAFMSASRPEAMKTGLAPDTRIVGLPGWRAKVSAGMIAKGLLLCNFKEAE